MTLMQKIIDKLASKESFCCRDKIVKDIEGFPMCDKCGCEVVDNDVLSKPVYIGDVLEKCIKPKIQGLDLGKNLLQLWGWCGFDRSLQEIAECGYETIVVKNRKLTEGGGYPKKILKDPNAQALADFINSIL